MEPFFELQLDVQVCTCNRQLLLKKKNNLGGSTNEKEPSLSDYCVEVGVLEFLIVFPAVFKTEAVFVKG